MKHITLSSGRVVSLTELHQGRTYAGVLSGKLDDHLNRSLIAGIFEEAQQYGPAGSKPQLVMPPSEIIAKRLPEVSCIAVFQSSELQGESEPYSSAVVVWFQDDFALPLPDAVVAYIRAMDWEATAAAWCP